MVNLLFRRRALTSASVFPVYLRVVPVTDTEGREEKSFFNIRASITSFKRWKKAKSFKIITQIEENRGKNWKKNKGIRIHKI